MFMVLLWHTAIASSAGSFDECRLAPDGHQHTDQAK